MALYHKWDVKNDFAYVLQFFSLISDSLGSVNERFAIFQAVAEKRAALASVAKFLRNARGYE